MSFSSKTKTALELLLSNMVKLIATKADKRELKKYLKIENLNSSIEIITEDKIDEICGTDILEVKEVRF